MAKTSYKQLINKWWQHLLLAIVCLILFWIIAIHAIDTGSLIEYTLGFIAFALCINQFIKTIQKLRK